MATCPDGRIRATFTHNPSTLRSACQHPNLQQLPRPKGPNDLSTTIRNLILASPGYIFIARDYSGIEAVLVGYFARSKEYIRLAKMDVHSFYTAYCLNALDGRVKSTDLPLLSWDDEKLARHLAGIKKEFKHDRNQLYKHLVHGCVTGDHEVLTPDGWVRFDSIMEGTPIAQWDNGEVRFVVPERIVRQGWEGSLITWSGQASSMVMTQDHRVPITNSFGKLSVVTAGDELPIWGRIPTAGFLDGSEELDPDLIRLLVAIQADSTLYGNHVVFHLVKDRKKKRLLSILRELRMDYAYAPCGCHSDGVRIRFSKKDLGLNRYISQKKDFNLETLLKLTSACKLIMLNELPYWDGVRGGKSGKQTAYITTNQYNAEVVQTLAHVAGLRSLIKTSFKGRGSFGTKPVLKVSLSHRRFLSAGSIETGNQPFSGTVYCVTVPSGWFLVRHNGKISVTGNSNFMQSPKGAREKIFAETGIEYPVETVAKVMGVYFELFPAIKKWHKDILLQADKDGFIRNPFGYIHRFNKTLDWNTDSGRWDWTPGPQANEAIAFLPQSTAAGMIKESMLRLWYNRFEEAGQYLRLLVHDELFLEVPLGMEAQVDAVVAEEMEKPVPELALPTSYGMGPFLIINTEAKSPNVRWGSM